VLLTRELEQQGHQVLSVENGKQALVMLAKDSFDLILLDIEMPELDGYQTLDALKNNTKLRHLPVIMVTSIDDVASAVRCIESGAEDYLPKPFNPVLLQARVGASLEKKRLYDLEQQYLKSLERELEIGRQIQAGFLPKEIPQPDGWQIEAYFQAAREVAGDFYDVFKMGRGILGLLLGDVTDKGVGSALYMALFRSLLRATVMTEFLKGEEQSEECLNPADCLLQAVTLTNNYICMVHDSAMYATLFFGILDTANGLLYYVNAGHNPPYLLRKNRILRQIMPSGPAVGMFANTQFRIESFVLQPGDSLVLYSDGIQDAQNTSGEMYGAERLRKLLQRPTSNPSKTFAALLSDIHGHLDGAAQYDDITLLMVNRE
jgi:sigma-B regulation protein RsbU (phosphoserine phosphatase)